MAVTLPQLLSASLLLRICLVLYGEVHDQHSLLKYTDVDYKVFSDAARHVRAGGSPYQRLTYRFVPSAFVILRGAGIYAITWRACLSFSGSSRGPLLRTITRPGLMTLLCQIAAINTFYR